MTKEKAKKKTSNGPKQEDADKRQVRVFEPWIGCSFMQLSDTWSVLREEYIKSEYSTKWMKYFPVRTIPESFWETPLHWNASCKKLRKRITVFHGNICDWTDPLAKSTWRTRLWNLIRETSELDWILVTEHPERIKKCLPKDWGNGYDNVCLGVRFSEDQFHRASKLLSIPSKKRLAMINGVVDPYDIDWLDKFEMLGFCEVPVSAMWAPLDFSNVDDEFSGLGIPLLIPDGEGYKVVECGIS